MLYQGNEDEVLDWLESLGFSDDETSKNKIILINRALQVSVQHNKLNTAKLLLGHGASMF